MSNSFWPLKECEWLKSHAGDVEKIESSEIHHPFFKILHNISVLLYSSIVIMVIKNFWVVAQQEIPSLIFLWQ